MLASTMAWERLDQGQRVHARVLARGAHLIEGKRRRHPQNSKQPIFPPVGKNPGNHANFWTGSERVRGPVDTGGGGKNGGFVCVSCPSPRFQEQQEGDSQCQRAQVSGEGGHLADALKQIAESPEPQLSFSPHHNKRERERDS